MVAFFLSDDQQCAATSGGDSLLHFLSHLTNRLFSSMLENLSGFYRCMSTVYKSYKLILCRCVIFNKHSLMFTLV